MAEMLTSRERPTLQPVENHPLYPSIRALKDEIQIMNLKQTQTNGLLCSIQEELKQLVKVVNTSNEKAFNIEYSSYKASVLKT